MNERLEKLRLAILSGGQHLRKPDEDDWGREFRAQGLTPLQRATERIVRLHAAEEPVIFPGERLVYTRAADYGCSSAARPPDVREHSCPLFTTEEWRDILDAHFSHFDGDANGLCPRFDCLLDAGTAAAADEVRWKRAAFSELGEEGPAALMDSMLRVISAIEDLAVRYREAAQASGNPEAASALMNVPFNRPSSFFEALLFLRILDFTLCLCSNRRVSPERIDQYLYPYFENDINSGVLSEEDALELVTEFFLP